MMKSQARNTEATPNAPYRSSTRSSLPAKYDDRGEPDRQYPDCDYECPGQHLPEPRSRGVRRLEKSSAHIAASTKVSTPMHEDIAGERAPEQTRWPND